MQKELENCPMLIKNKNNVIVCKHAWTSMDIYPNGNVTPCCYLPKKVLGNVNKTSLENIWNGDEYKNFRKEMSTKGAFVVCGGCCVISGMNSWDHVDFYKQMPENSIVRRNSELNEKEIINSVYELKSKPRRLKYTPSYRCNLSCYHCCQDQYRERDDSKLDYTVLERIKNIIPTLEILYPFGGEPFIQKELDVLIDYIKTLNKECVFFTTTNANYVTNKHWEFLEEIPLGKITISFDGHTKETYEKYRTKANWEQLLKNVKLFSELKKRKPFNLLFNTSFNNETYKELPIFLDMCKEFGAIGRPVVMQLKSNHNFAFWHKYLKISKKERNGFIALIENALKRENLPEDTKGSLTRLKRDVLIWPNSNFEFLLKMRLKPALRKFARKILKVDNYKKSIHKST